MHTRRFVCYSVATALVLGFALSPGDGAPPNTCGEGGSALECLKRNFAQLYFSDYDKFWRILRAAAVRARDCEKPGPTAQFLDLAQLRTNNAEFNEFFSQVLEELAVSRTECFLLALSETSDEVKASVSERLRNPLVVEPAALTRAFQRFKDGKYGHLVKPYLQGDP